MVTIQGIKPSDFFETSKDKALLNWYCYELAQAFETELIMYADDPSFKKWLKRPIVRPLAIELTNQLKQTIMTRNLSTPMSLAVGPALIEKHVKNLPKNSISELVSSLNDIVYEQAEACKHCPTRCLKNKNARCSMFDDPLHSKPLSRIGEDIGTDTSNENVDSVNVNSVHAIDDDEETATVTQDNAIITPAAAQIITEFLDVQRKRVKEQTRKTYERVMVSLRLYIINRRDELDTKTYMHIFDSSNTSPLTLLSPFLIRYMNDTEYLYHYFSMSITVMKQVPSIMANFIEFMVSKGLLDKSDAIDLNRAVKKLRGEITRNANSTTKKQDAMALPSIKIDPMAEASRIIKLPMIMRSIEAILSGHGTTDTLIRNIRREIRSGIDPKIQQEIEQHVFSLIEKFVATMHGGADSTSDILDDDLDPTNYDGVMLASNDIELEA